MLVRTSDSNLSHLVLSTAIASGISVVQLFAVFTPGESVFANESQRRIILTAALTLTYVQYHC